MKLLKIGRRYVNFDRVNDVYESDYESGGDSGNLLICFGQGPDEALLEITGPHAALLRDWLDANSHWLSMYSKPEK